MTTLMVMLVPEKNFVIVLTRQCEAVARWVEYHAKQYRAFGRFLIPLSGFIVNEIESE